jgi:enterochelin esterase-like enzyme
MPFFHKILKFLNLFENNNQEVFVKQINVPSTYLKRGVTIDAYLPPNYGKDKKQTYPVIFFNDGQDLSAMSLTQTLNELYADKAIPPTIVFGIYANPNNRVNEYGTARQADYRGRGNLANQYTSFVINELLPILNSEFACTDNAVSRVFAGFSLGGLSAMDLVWAHPDFFTKVGVFSGSLWWRSAPYQYGDFDQHRIMHNIVLQSAYQKNMKFWFQVGTNDETADRNNNGIIDAIDDTLDLINDLSALGYKPHDDIKYVEVQNGEHNPQTWGAVMPDFLKWATGN